MEYLYILSLYDHKKFKIGYTKNVYGRLTGDYGTEKFEGLMENYLFDLHNSFCIKVDNPKQVEIQLKSKYSAHCEIDDSNKSGVTEIYNYKAFDDIFEEFANLSDRKLIRLDRHSLEDLNKNKPVYVEVPKQTMFSKYSSKLKRTIDFSSKDEELFEALSDLRYILSKKENKPAYFIFKNDTLHEIVKQKPTTLEQLSKIKGIGDVKIKNYGDLVIKLFEV